VDVGEVLDDLRLMNDGRYYFYLLSFRTFRCFGFSRGIGKPNWAFHSGI
jgi:hypothetical protein